MKNMICAAIVGLYMGLVSACGGGDPGSVHGTSTQPTKAVLQISAAGGPSGIKLSGVGVTVHLPAGVTAKTDSTGAVLASVVTPSGVAAGGTLTPPQYTPAQGTAPGALSFVLASSSAGGFGAGEFVTVNLDITTGTSVHATDFTLSDFHPIDLNYADVTDMRASFTADIR